MKWRKTSSTKEIIEYFEAYEKIHGVGSIHSIGTICSGARNIEYIFHIVDKDNIETHVEIPSIYEEDLW